MMAPKDCRDLAGTGCRLPSSIYSTCCTQWTNSVNSQLQLPSWTTSCVLISPTRNTTQTHQAHGLAGGQVVDYDSFSWRECSHGRMWFPGMAAHAMGCVAVNQKETMRKRKVSCEREARGRRECWCRNRGRGVQSNASWVNCRQK